ncbi:MAG: beta-propeller domain-containing protein, partial [Deltaproteobacteria bacterium]|nr:beta-propeller domain-containing protein [Deltaproteobacteria bacterium]
RRFDVDLTDGIEVTSGHLTDCGDTYHPGEATGSSILTVLTLDMELAEYETSSLSVISSGLVLYASPSNLFVAGGIAGARSLWSADPSLLPTISHIHQFDISTQPGSALYTASGTIDGFVLNQFSMSEYNGDLRVATTYGETLADARNSVQVLRRNGASLDIIGRADDIAPGEELYAARFMGPIGYLVTYPTPDEDPWEDPWDDWGDDDWWDGDANNDPLFTIDLTDHENPTVRGELIVPGFSTYIHPFDAGHLMTIGESGDDSGADGGVALSMFDVTDLDDPQRIHHVDLGDWDVSSDAKFDHHAFLFWPTTGLLAIPLEMADWFGNPFSGVFAFHVDVPTGFEFRADIAHTEFTGEEGSDNYGGLSVPRRSVVIGTYLITISDLGIVVTDMPTWTDLLRVDLPWKDRTLEGR